LAGANVQTLTTAHVIQLDFQPFGVYL
jgi:hypothetical protein